MFSGENLRSIFPMVGLGKVGARCRSGVTGGMFPLSLGVWRDPDLPKFPAVQNCLLSPAPVVLAEAYFCRCDIFGPTMLQDKVS